MDHSHHIRGALGSIVAAENSMDMSNMTGMESTLPGMGTDMPGMGTDMTGMGTDMSGMGSDMPGMGSDMPGMGSDMPGMGSDMPGMGSDMPCMDMDMDGMKMYFHGGCTEVILFDFWRIDEVWELLLSMLGIFLIAFLYEGLKHCREYLFRRSVHTSQYATSNNGDINMTGAASNGAAPQGVRYYEDFIIPSSMQMLSLPHAAQTGLHMLQFFIAYLLMLIFMTYNVYLCLAVLLGSGLGYFVFGWRKAVVVDLAEHCH